MNIKKFISVFPFAAVSLAAQAIPAASKLGSLFIGAGYVRANADYSPASFQGLLLFGAADFSEHFGAEAKYHRIRSPAPDAITETTYELGIRSKIRVGPLTPFVDFSAGLGSFNYLRGPQNGSYGMFAGGSGVEYSITRNALFRGEYEYQKWNTFPPRGLQPNLVSVSVAYRLR